MPDYAPQGWRTVTPRIFVKDHHGLIAFVKRVFGATGDDEPNRPTVLTIGDSMIMVSGDDFRGPMTACLYVYVDDVDGTWRRAVDAGATSIEAPQKMPYGDRRATITDGWGNVWQIARHRGTRE